MTSEELREILLQDIENRDYDHFIDVVQNPTNQHQISEALMLQNRHGENILHYVAESGNTEIFKAALKAIPEDQRSDALIQQDSYGNTVLHYAAFSKNTEIFTAALAAIPEDQRANALMQQDSYGNTVL